MTKKETIENFDKWIEFLKPDNLKGNLISCALYIALYESFKTNVIEKVKFFYNTGFNGNEFIFSPSYTTEVLSKDKNILRATLLWLKEREAVDETDLLEFKKIKEYRNKLAHEMMTLLFEGTESLPDRFSQLITIQIKIEKWWLLNIEIPTNHDFDGKEINEADVITSSQITTKLMLDILTGDEKTANYYYNEFIKHKTNSAL